MSGVRSRFSTMSGASRTGDRVYSVRVEAQLIASQLAASYLLEVNVEIYVVAWLVCNELLDKGSVFALPARL